MCGFKKDFLEDASVPGVLPCIDAYSVHSTITLLLQTNKIVDSWAFFLYTKAKVLWLLLFWRAPRYTPRAECVSGGDSRERAKEVWARGDSEEANKGSSN